jgi:hypothetical protein
LTAPSNEGAIGVIDPERTAPAKSVTPAKVIAANVCLKGMSRPLLSIANTRREVAFGFVFRFSIFVAIVVKLLHSAYRGAVMLKTNNHRWKSI